MSIHHLSDREKNVIFEAMKAMLAETDWIEDWEFHPRLGIERCDLAWVISIWPEVAESDVRVKCAINGSLNELCYGLGISESDWQSRFDFSRQDLLKTFDKWKSLTVKR